MHHDIEIAGRFARVRVSGKPSAEGFAATANTLVSMPGWHAGMNILVDYRELDLSRLPGYEVKLFARALAPYRAQLGKGRCAVFHTMPVNFGLGRMWEAFMAQYSDLRVGVFYTLDEAQHWVASQSGRDANVDGFFSLSE